jgi:hypothetical protein
MWNDFILISDTETVNSYGDIVKVETERHVYGLEKSVGGKEFYQAQAVGFKPEIKVVLTNWLDYHGEHRMKYTPFGMTEPITFTVIRSYRDGESIELTLEREVDVP